LYFKNYGVKLYLFKEKKNAWWHFW